MVFLISSLDPWEEKKKSKYSEDCVFLKNLSTDTG